MCHCVGMQSCCAAASLLNAWWGVAHWRHKHCVKWCYCSSMVSRGKTKKKKERVVGGKETLADPKANYSFFFNKTPACDWAIVVNTEKLGVFSLRDTEVTHLNAWMKQNLGSMFIQGKAASLGNTQRDQFSHLQFHNIQPPNGDVQRQSPLWFLKWFHHYQFAAATRQIKDICRHFWEREPSSFSCRAE